jgi:hypothetical protein
VISPAPAADAGHARADSTKNGWTGGASHAHHLATIASSTGIPSTGRGDEGGADDAERCDGDGDHLEDT